MRWKSLILGLTLALAPSVPVHAGQAVAPAPVAKPVDAHPALWVVKDRDTTIYLFGTIHLLKPEIRWFEGPVRAAFDDAQQVVLEVVSKNEPNAQSDIMKRALDAEAPPLTSRLPEPLRAKYLAALEANGLAPILFDRVKPWFATFTLSMLPLRTYGYDPDSGADHKIEQAATAAGKTLTGLETADQQIGYFESLSEPVQIKMLGETLDELPSLRETIEKMISYWAAGDPDRLGELMNESVDSDPELERILLTDRNARWADWIKARLDQPGTVFIAVGAGHLAGGKGSVQAMLKQRGLSVRLIRQKKR